MSIDQYKKSIMAACDLYKQEIKKKSKTIHPIRLKDLNIFYDLLHHIDEKNLLNLKMKEHLIQMTTRGRIWTLYILSTGDSRLKHLIESTIDYYDADNEYEFLKKSLQYYELELQKRDVMHQKTIKAMHKDHERLLELKEKQYEHEVKHLKTHIEFLVDENSTLKEMLAKQSNIIKKQLDQIMTLELSETEIKCMDQDKSTLISEMDGLNKASVFHPL